MILTDKNTICNRYIRRQICKYKSKKVELIISDKKIRGIRFRRLIHPFLTKLLQIKSKISGLTYEFINENRVKHTNKPVIYAITHIGKYDYEMLMEACPTLFGYAFAGDWELMYMTVNDTFMQAMGVLWVDTSDKDDRKNSFHMMCKYLRQGVSFIIYPEGIWNLTENLPMMKIYPGVVKAAQQCDVSIVPIGIEQGGKHFLLNVGKEFSVLNMDESVAVQLVRDTLATLKWEIWETLPKEKRKDIPNDYYEKFLNDRISECAGFTLELIQGRMYKDKKDREIAEIKKDLREYENRE